MTDLLTSTVLPDSRAREVRNVRFVNGLCHRPIYCANCGADGGMVPEENMTFAFYLCNPCFETYGVIAGTMAMPDEVFWEKVRQEQLAQFGRVLTAEELTKVVETDASPLATLIKTGR